MRKPAFSIAKTKTQISFAVTTKLISAFVFALFSLDSTIPLLSKSEISSFSHLLFPTAWFVLDLVGNPEDRFSYNDAHMLGASLV